MQGCRPLTNDEIDQIRATLAPTRLGPRNVALFDMGVQTGFRVSELLALELGDVIQGGRVVSAVTVARRHMKRKMAGRTISLTRATRASLLTWLTNMRSWGYTQKRHYLFQSSRRGNTSLSPSKVWKIIHDAARACGCTGNIGTHSMRKTFAERIYYNAWERRNNGEMIEPLIVVQEALGHRSIESTRRYLSFCTQIPVDILEHVFGRSNNGQGKLIFD